MERGSYTSDYGNRCSATVSLRKRELWQKFNSSGTEMIITKSGRRLFPTLQIQVTDMDPHEHYCILLEFTPASNCRFKYSNSGGWAPTGAEEAQSPHRVYFHPESPATGDYWMSQPIGFGRLKLTNTPAPPAGHVVLSSMHKYQPRIIIAKTSDPRAIAWSPSTSVAFPETQFIAVTAYQNEKITKLKIDHNPFAKGFRENGQSKCKRKRILLEDKEPKKKPKLEIALSPSSEEDKGNSCQDSCGDSPQSTPIKPVQTYPFHCSPKSVLPTPLVWTYNYPQYPMWGAIAPFYYPNFFPQQQFVMGAVKKFTDFSINTIIGCL